MFYKHEPPPPQIRTRCRNPRCAGKLKTSTDNSRDAFCCSGCEKQYYDRHCRVCETVISPQKTKPRAVCWRSHCRHEFQRHPEQYFGARYPSSPVGQISSRSAHSTGLKSDAKSGRGWRVIAGPADDLAHKTEGQIDTAYYILGPEMRGRLEEARPCVLVTCIYRDGSPRLWPIMFPREGEKDNTAWTSARSAARTAIDKWVRLVWSKRSYLTRDALPGYAPDPDWKKVPPFDEMVRVAFGPHGVIQDTNHPIYRELMGAPATVNGNDDI
jgi:hypothetical protein